MIKTAINFDESLVEILKIEVKGLRSWLETVIALRHLKNYRKPII